MAVVTTAFILVAVVPGLLDIFPKKDIVSTDMGKAHGSLPDLVRASSPITAVGRIWFTCSTASGPRSVGWACRVPEGALRSRSEVSGSIRLANPSIQVREGASPEPFRCLASVWLSRPQISTSIRGRHEPSASSAALLRNPSPAPPPCASPVRVRSEDVPPPAAVAELSRVSRDAASLTPLRRRDGRQTRRGSPRLACACHPATRYVDPGIAH